MSRDARSPKAPPGAWIDHANCLGLPADWFVPESGRGSRAAKYTEARKVCAACSVRQECLDYAMASPVEISGFWGGLTPRERQRLTRRRLAS